MDEERKIEYCVRELKRVYQNADSYEDMEKKLKEMYEKYGFDIVQTAREETGI